MAAVDVSVSSVLLIWRAMDFKRTRPGSSCGPMIQQLRDIVEFYG